MEQRYTDLYCMVCTFYEICAELSQNALCDIVGRLRWRGSEMSLSSTSSSLNNVLLRDVQHLIIVKSRGAKKWA